MKNDTKSSESGSKWLRFGFMLLFIIFYGLAETIVYAMMLVQFIFVLITGAPNERLKTFGGELGIYIKEIVGYITYYHDRKVFPFEPWVKID